MDFKIYNQKQIILTNKLKMKNYSVIEKINNNIIRVRRTNNKLVVKVNLFIGSFNFFHKKEYLRIYI